MVKPAVVVHMVSVYNETVNIPVNYSISVDEDIHTIFCNIELENFHSPSWLQIRKFQIRSRLLHNRYTQLFSDHQARNLDSIQFVDETYREIMKLEHHQIENR